MEGLIALYGIHIEYDPSANYGFLTEKEEDGKAYVEYNAFDPKKKLEDEAKFVSKDSLITCYIEGLISSTEIPCDFATVRNPTMTGHLSPKKREEGVQNTKKLLEKVREALGDQGTP